MSEEHKWLIEPAAPGEVKMKIDVGEGAKLTPAFEAAIETLIKEIQKTDDTKAAISCKPFTFGPCRLKISCEIRI